MGGNRGADDPLRTHYSAPAAYIPVGALTLYGVYNRETEVS